MRMYNDNYSFKTYWKDELTCEVKIRGSQITFQNYTDDPLKLPFGVRTEEEVDINYLEEMFEDRCFPRERVNCKDILRRLGLDCYEPELICRKTHGMQFDDFFWIKFDNDEESLCWDDIKLRD